MRGRPASMSSSFFFLLLHCYLLFLLSLTPWRSSCAQHMLLPNSSLPADLLAGGGGGNKVVTDGLRRYLARFGYINMSQPADEDGLLRLYQQTMGIPPTGLLDNLTAGLLSTPRCGVPDLPNVTSRFAYLDGQPRWTTSSRGAGGARPHHRFTLTYAIMATTANDARLQRPSAVRAAFRRAFARWARVIPVRFVELNTGFSYNTAADVKVGFFSGDHGDGEPFDGPLGVLAHAFSPPSGQLHLDAAERWTVGAHDDSSAVDLESVATHEIGHVLGLAHSSAPDAVMYPSLKPGTRKVDLTADDVRGVQALYGSNPRFSLSSLSEPADTSSSSQSEASAQASPPAILLLLLLLTVMHI